ncbi:MAG: hypothetical protein R3Y56_02270 [Akkermansia sp.]
MSSQHYWIALQWADIARVLNTKERAIVCNDDHRSDIEADLFDMVCRVREAVATNGSNSISADRALIPRTLRACALHILRVQWLTRYALPITQDRKDASDAAEEMLKAVADGTLAVMDENGDMPSHADESPAIVAPRPAYGNDGVGWYPTPNS